MSPMFEVLESRDLVSTTIQGDTFDAGEMMVDGMHTAGVVFGDAAIAPSGVIISNQSVLIGDAPIAPAGVIVGDNSVFGDAPIAPAGVIIGDGSGGAQGITISEEFQAHPAALDAMAQSSGMANGDATVAASGVITGDAAIAPAGVLVADNTVLSNAAIAAAGVIVGDNSVFGKAAIDPAGVIIGDGSGGAGGAQGTTISDEFRTDLAALDAVFASDEPILGLDLAAYGITVGA